MNKTYQCQCGDWGGEPCVWRGPASDMVIVEWMPDEHRASHTAAGNSGSFPDNGSQRIVGEDAAAVEATATESEADTSHTLEMRDDGGSTETVEFDECPSADEIAEACRDWVEGGEWGDNGVSVQVSWTLTDAADEEIDAGIEDVDIEPNHDALIRAVGGDADCRHDWTSEGEGGCKENPGVWSTGGTSMVFRAHCTICGLIRIEHDPGSQRNPGEHPTVSYFVPDEDD